MIIPDGTLELAMARLFAGIDARPGRPVLFSRIAEEWEKSGLRFADLRDAIRVLVDKRYLKALDEGGRLGFELTAAGHNGLAKLEASASEAQSWLSQMRKFPMDREGWNAFGADWDRRRSTV